MATAITNQHILSASIEDGDVVFTNGTDPKGIRLKIDALSTLFSQVSETHSIVRLRQRAAKDTDRHLMTFNLKISDLFNALGKEPEGFVRLPELSVPVPIEFSYNPENKDRKKTDEFRHNVLTKAIENGRPSVHRSNTIVVDYDGWLPEDCDRTLMYVYEGESLVAKNAVDEIVDRGAYREVFFKDDTHHDIRISVTTAVPMSELETAFPDVGKAAPEEPPAPKSETIADVMLRRLRRYL